MSKPNRVRLKDIADRLGLSVVTVSRALKDHPDISEPTKQRVRQLAQQLGYRPNFIARGLVTQRTNLIGLVVPDLMHSFFAEIARALEEVVEGQGLRIVMANSEEDVTREASLIDSLLGWQVDGLVIASACPVNETASLQHLVETGVPFVLIDRYYEDVRAPYVGVDDEALGMVATRHLISCGRRAIAHLCGRRIPPAVGRLRGYAKALRQSGMRVRRDYIQTTNGTVESGYKMMKKLLRLPRPPDGVFCYNDPVAVGAMLACLDEGVAVPDDVAIVGAGNIRYSHCLKVSLTTVDQGSHKIGKLAGELLLKMLQDARYRKAEQIIIPPRLVVRESTSCVATKSR